MHLPSRHVTIGLVVSVIIIPALVLTWWRTSQPEDSLALRLPADAVLAYAEFPPGDPHVLPVFSFVAPELSPPGSLGPTASAIAAVRLPDASIRWVTYEQQPDGTGVLGPMPPALAALLSESSPRLSSDRTFRTLRPKEQTGWIELLYPRLPSDTSPFRSLLALETPIAFVHLTSPNSLTVRMPLRPTPSLAPWSGRPLVTLTTIDLALNLPAWNTLVRLGQSLTPAARTVTTTLASTFLQDIAANMSLRYDLSLLLAQPSYFQKGQNGSGDTVFSLEGNGSTAEDTDRVLRSLHEHVASTHGGGIVRTVTAEGFSMRTLTPAHGSGTTERTDGPWTILETATEDLHLVSAHQGSRYVVTTAPDALFTQPGDGGSLIAPASIIRWSDDIATLLRPLWPDLRPDGGFLRIQFREGAAYVEWSLETLQTL